MNRRYLVELTDEERAHLIELTTAGTQGVRKLRRARLLLMTDRCAHTDEQIVAALHISLSTIYRTRKRFVQGNLPNALHDKQRPGASRKLTANQEASLVALACSEPPRGRCRWTTMMLADNLVLMCDELESLSAETVRRRLKEKKLKPWLKKMWCIQKVTAEFIARMEDVLELYAEEPDPRYPVICFDEGLKQLIGELKTPRLVRPGQSAQQDYHYKRNGTAKLLVFLDVHRSWREVIVSESRTRTDFALAMRRLVDEYYPNAKRIRVVLDNLNTHGAASLYTAFPASEARRILRRLEFHYTPRHASWLNMVEIEIGAMTTQCLDRRIAKLETLREEVTAWVAARNASGARIKWLFDVLAAREKMARHYPTPTTTTESTPYEPSEMVAA